MRFRLAADSLTFARHMLQNHDHKTSSESSAAQMPGRGKVLVLFGTRPEIIKVAPVIAELRRSAFETVVVSSSQHTNLLTPFLKTFGIVADHDLKIMRRDQSPGEVCARVIEKLDKIIVAERPQLILVQGDTTTALAGALAGFYRGVMVGHIEAGLRSGDIMSPFPEEMNRRMISQAARFHFAATADNRENLLKEGVEKSGIFVTGNTIVDSLNSMLAKLAPSSKIAGLIDKTAGMRRLLVTTHRRESFGPALTHNLEALRDFVSRHADVCMLFPVHPNPNVKKAATELLGGCDRIHLLDPLDYADFLSLMRASWLIVSDSGGVQEEAPSLGKPLLVLRENTERPEALAAGVSKLVGGEPHALEELLEQNYNNDEWIRSVSAIANPFGDGRAARRIVQIIKQNVPESRTAPATAAVL